MLMLDDVVNKNIDETVLFDSIDLLENEKEICVVLFEYASENKRRRIQNWTKIEFMKRNKIPIKIIQYGDTKFGIFKNEKFHYHFFANVLICQSAKYRKILKWYLDKTGSSSIHRIELESLKKEGPGFTQIAIPIKSAKYDIGYKFDEKNKFLKETESNLQRRMYSNYLIHRNEYLKKERKNV